MFYLLSYCPNKTKKAPIKPSNIESASPDVMLSPFTSYPNIPVIKGCNWLSTHIKVNERTVMQNMLITQLNDPKKDFMNNHPYSFCVYYLLKGSRW